MVRSRASYENSQRLSREAKRRRTGICVDCGAVTRYNGRGVAKRCLTCANRVTAKPKIGKGSGQVKVLAFLSEPRRYSEVRDELGLTNEMASVTLHRLRSHGLVERVSRGVYVRVKA